MSIRELHPPLTILQVRESLATLHAETVHIPNEFRMRSNTWKSTLKPLLAKHCSFAGIIDNAQRANLLFMGMQIIEDETVAPNEIEVRDTNGVLIQLLRFEL